MLAKWKWQDELIARAERIVVADGGIAVPPLSDLILLKLSAGGYSNLQDAAALLAIGDSDATIRRVEAHVGELRPDVRPLWRDLLAARQR